MRTQQQNLQPNLSPGRQEPEGRFFGIPLGGLGFITSVLMAFTVGFMSFFLFTFLAIIGIVIYNDLGHQVDLAASYKYISFPAASVVLLISLIFFARLWLRRKLSRG